MTVQNALEEMKERAFAPAFQKYLFDTYKVLAQTDFSEEEKDYTAAEDYEIIESPLYAENIEEKGGAADDAAKTDLL